ncbi:MAG TPA: FIST N-terminal domain-containing protein, partial [Acidimicrobiia bacterium]
MSRFASALSQHPIPAHAVGEAAGEIVEALDGEDADLVVCFASPHFVGAMEDISFALRKVLEPRVLLGMTAVAVIGGPREVEDAPALSLFAACVPDATFTTAGLTIVRTHDGNAIAGWPSLDHDPSTMLLLADPFTFPIDALLPRLNEDRPGLEVVGGAASAARGP